MNEHIAALAGQNFYATPDALRSFLSLIMDVGGKAASLMSGGKRSISSYGEEYVTIEIKGLMLREQSWITDMGYATSTEEVISEIKLALAQGKKIKLMINSGGGLVSGTSNLVDLIAEHRENIEIYVTGGAASAAMWVFSAGGKRYAESTSILGSIGVVTSVWDDEGYWKQHGIVWKDIVSANAKNKRPDVKTESGVAEVRRYLTSLETVFLDSVAANLGMAKEDVIKNFHEGGLITGLDAMALGVIESLISYDTVATMPTARNADEIAYSFEDDEMITQEQLDAVQSQLDDAKAAVADLEGQLAGADATVESAISDATKSALGAAAEIVAMAFEHGADKDTTLAMLSKGSPEGASMVLLESQKSEGATVEANDLGASTEDAEDEAEMAYALELANKLSVNRKH